MIVPKGYLQVSEVAKKLGCTKWNVYKMIKSKKFTGDNLVTFNPTNDLMRRKYTRYFIKEDLFKSEQEDRED